VAEVYCQVGPNQVAQRARLDMVEQVFSEPFYDTLRTKEQLGYSVHCSTRLTHGILGFAFVVISGKKMLVEICLHAPSQQHMPTTTFSRLITTSTPCAPWSDWGTACTAPLG